MSNGIEKRNVHCRKPDIAKTQKLKYYQATNMIKARETK